MHARGAHTARTAASRSRSRASIRWWIGSCSCPQEQNSSSWRSSCAARRASTRRCSNRFAARAMCACASTGSCMISARRLCSKSRKSTRLRSSWIASSSARAWRAVWRTRWRQRSTQVRAWSTYRWWTAISSCSARISPVWTAAFRCPRSHRACSHSTARSARAPSVQGSAVTRSLTLRSSSQTRRSAWQTVFLHRSRKIRIPTGCGRSRRSWRRTTMTRTRRGTAWTRRRRRCCSMGRMSMFPFSTQICSARRRNTMSRTRAFCPRSRVATVRRTRRRCARATRTI